MFVAESLASRAGAAKRRADARAAARAETKKGQAALAAGDLVQARSAADAAVRLYREAGEGPSAELARLISEVEAAERRERAAEQRAAGQAALAEAEDALARGMMGLASTRLLAARCPLCFSCVNLSDTFGGPSESRETASGIILKVGLRVPVDSLRGRAAGM